MSYRIIAISKFEKDLKRLAKKYPSLKAEKEDIPDKELSALVKQLPA